MLILLYKSHLTNTLKENSQYKRNFVFVWIFVERLDTI